ncbi:MAG: hypothetical protein ACREWI_08580, partial [Telluria sp.]
MRRLLLALLTSLVLAFQGSASADITQQLRMEVEAQAKLLSLSHSIVMQELRIAGFLDDKQTARLAQRATPGNVLAWAALQAEEAKAGAALDLLETVAKGIAARHVDAIRYEPQLAYLFRASPTGPIRAPLPRRFEFKRMPSSGAAAVAHLPPKAQALLAPLAKYALVYPG